METLSLKEELQIKRVVLCQLDLFWLLQVQKYRRTGYCATEVLMRQSGDKSELFSVTGTLYGGGNGQFRVPDLRQTFVMGANAANVTEQVGKNGNADRHSHLITPPETSTITTTGGYHNHEFPKRWYKKDFGGVGHSGLDTDGTDVKEIGTEYAGSHHHLVTVKAPVFRSDTYTGDNRPKWLAMNYIIKY